MPVTNHGYRGGPFVVDGVHLAQALSVVQAWQLVHPQVSVHRATASFTAQVSRELLHPPTIAVFADGNEEIAFKYLNPAGIPMGNGLSWPSKKDGSALYPCPGTLCCPDCLGAPATAGATTSNHKDGALFDSKGVLRYCQFMSMHYGAPANTPEVVAEVREFLRYPVHFFAECQAVNAFENDVHGRFLTGNGLKAAGNPGTVDRFHSDDPFAQADGPYTNPGGSEPSYALDTGSYYYSANTVLVSKAGSPSGLQDVWMNGFLDDDPTYGKVSYLGGHEYSTNLPISGNPKTQGTRYFLNSLFEAPCSTALGDPTPATSVTGAAGTNSGTYTLSVCFDNAGPGIAFGASLTLNVPAGVTVVSGGGGTPSADALTWTLESIPPGDSACHEVTVTLPAEGAYSFTSTLRYSVGLDVLLVSSPSPLQVNFSQVNLHRYGGATGTAPLTPSRAEIFMAPYPADPSLDPARDLEAVPFVSGAPFPHDLSDLLPSGPPMVFYQLQGNTGNTLRLRKPNGAVVVTF